MAGQSSLYVINTCAVTSMAEAKSRNMVQKITRTNPSAKIILIGCAAQNNLAQFKSQNIIKSFGTSDKEMILQYLLNYEFPSEIIGEQLEKRTKSYFLKVQDGCDNRCSFCLVSTLRGKSISRPLDEIITEAQKVTQPEIVITGINLTQFEPGLDILCAEINKIGKPFRISSLYVDALAPKFIDKLGECENLVPNFHLSIQTCSDPVLRSMGRRYATHNVVDVLKNIRAKWGSTRVSADIIVGFPTETDADFAETKRVLKSLALDRLHVFPYSPRPGTPAAGMKQIQSSIITARAQELKNL